MLRLRSLLAAALLAPVLLAADVPLPELFARAKAEFGSGNYKESLADFDLLDATSRKAGYEADIVAVAGLRWYYEINKIR